VNQKTTILIVDDEADVREVLEEYFVSHGYAVIGAESAGAAKAAAGKHVIDLALVDIHMPGEDGLSLARHLRERYAKIAIVMLTSAATVVDRIVGLEMGADDYVPKPFDPRELLARVKSVLRRMQAREGEAGHAADDDTTMTAPPEAAAPAANAAVRVRFGRCRLDVDARRLFEEDGQEIAMTAMEFDLLRVFLANPNRVLSRDQLLQRTRNREWEPFDRSIDIRIGRLRRKIEPDPQGEPRCIRTVRNAGYMYVPI